VPDFQVCQFSKYNKYNLISVNTYLKQSLNPGLKEGFLKLILQPAITASSRSLISGWPQGNWRSGS